MSLPIKMNGLEKLLSEDDINTLKQVIMGFAAGKELTKWDDNVFLPGFSAEAAQYCFESLNLKEGDVLVASYPKTGTIWALEIIQHIIYQDKDEYELAFNIPHPFICLGIAPGAKFPVVHKLSLQRRLAMSHMQSNLINVEKYKKANAKIVCVLRNPKDQMVSYYHFLKTIPNGQVEPLLSMHNSGWDKYFDHVIQGDIPSTMKPGLWYPDHVLTWYKHKDNKNVYFMYYEDMVKDLEGQIKLLAKFLDTPITEDKVKCIAEASRFNNMKKKRVTGDDVMSHLMAANMRKGGAGGWKDYFTVSQSEQIDELLEKKLKDTDIKFTYEL